MSNGRLCGWLGVTRLQQLGLSDLFDIRDLSVPLVEKVVMKKVWQVGGQYDDSYAMTKRSRKSPT